jgi:hypothetical protein
MVNGNLRNSNYFELVVNIKIIQIIILQLLTTYHLQSTVNVSQRCLFPNRR